MLNLYLVSPGWTFEIYTHRDLTEEAIHLVEADLNTYLIKNLGLEGGLNVAVTGGTPRDLMKQGSIDEDTEAFASRVLNHFHDPLSNHGLFLSAISWSLAPMGSQFPGGDWSWNDAREYYFKALTSETKAERDENWGKTFEALGHVMHLVQDMASPAHVRHDPHLSDKGRGDVDGLHDFMDNQLVSDYVGSGIGPDTSILEQAGATRAEPFSNLFDHNQYTGSNPSASLGGQAGLAEYANANFFSDDRIPGQPRFFNNSITNPEWRSYPYPSLTELVPESFSSPYRTLPRLGASPNSRAAKFTGNQVFTQYVLTNLGLDLLSQLQLDDAVYDAQAQNLIPRAIDYSAAVLDYFFRGELDVTRHEFEVLGTTLGAGLCDPTPDPVVDDGLLEVEFTIPSDLNFDGTAFLYYEQDETRVLVDERTNSPSGQNFSLRGNILYADLDDPVRWYVVLDGDAGPGAQEKPRAIVATSDKAAWEFVCLF